MYNFHLLLFFKSLKSLNQTYVHSEKSAESMLCALSMFFITYVLAILRDYTNQKITQSLGKINDGIFSIIVNVVWFECTI